jgi:hypothetical protein
MPARLSRDYIYYCYYFKDLKYVFDTYIKEERANGGKFTVLGQLILHCFYIGKSKNFFIKKIRGCFLLFCNTVFPWLDDKKKDESYTLNYIFVGQNNYTYL